MSSAARSPDRVRCPDCGALLDGVADEVLTEAEGDVVRAAADCRACGAALELVAESALPVALGADVSVERRTVDAPPQEIDPAGDDGDVVDDLSGAAREQ